MSPCKVPYVRDARQVDLLLKCKCMRASERMFVWAQERLWGGREMKKRDEKTHRQKHS